MVGKLRGWTQGFSMIHSFGVYTGGKAGARYLPGDQGYRLAGQRIINIYRRGKLIVFSLSNGLLVCHNAMSGFWDAQDDPWTFDYVEGKRTSGKDDVQVTLLVYEGDPNKGRFLRFHDVRKFGSLKFTDWDALLFPVLTNLGPEAINTPCVMPNAPAWSARDLVTSCDRSKRPIKEILMDQHEVAGIGNIYANEALFEARIDPRKLGKDLPEIDIRALFPICQQVLRSALTRNLDYSGLRVYRKKECPVCGSGIISFKLKGRGTYMCPDCQS